MTLHKTCQQWRRILVRHSTRDTRGEQWVTRTCDLPLFDHEEKRRGRCRSCISGWTHPESYPVETPSEITPEEITKLRLHRCAATDDTTDCPA